MKYFSDKEKVPAKRNHEIINTTVWAGIEAHIQSLISTCAFAQRFPEMCPDGAGPVATNEKMFSSALQAEIPGMVWPLETTRLSSDEFTSEPFAPDTMMILDLIEFCYSKVSKATQTGYHNYFQHYHLTFDIDEGRSEFREMINTIFERNGIAFELRSDGSIYRIIPHMLGESLTKITYQTGDSTLDSMLEEACKKILSPRLEIRKESLERLWDAWERLKSLQDPDKKKSTGILLDKASGDLVFRELLENEAKQLTEIGNTFQIRHKELGKTPISDHDHLDYLFHRLFALISLLLTKK